MFHHTGAAVDKVGVQTAERIDEWHRNRVPPFKMIGYHYVVLRNGLIQIGRPIGITPASVKDQNTGTVAVVMNGNFMVEDTPDILNPQARAAGLLITFLRRIYELKQQRPLVFRVHKEMAATDCPGDNLPPDSIRAYLDFVRPREGVWREWYVKHVAEFALYNPGFDYVGGSNHTVEEPHT